VRSRRLANRFPQIAALVLIGVALLGIVGCGQLLPISCDMPFAVASAGGSGNLHEYEYRLDCDENIDGEVNASWDATTRIAQEKLEGSYGTVTAEWVCPFDPWVRLDGQPEFTCTQNWRLADLDVDEGTLYELVTSPPTRYPYSAHPLDGNERRTLNERLGVELNAPPKPTPTATPQPYVADLTVVRISPQPGLGNEVDLGKYAIFAVEVRNIGQRAADPVELILDFGGAISGSVNLPPGDFDCTGEGATVICKGTLSSIDTPITASATFSTWVKGERDGVGTISASVNPRRQLTETDYNNNSEKLEIRSQALTVQANTGALAPAQTPMCFGQAATITGSGTITGTAGNDVIVGSPGPDTIDGLGGSDLICGLEGDDVLIGGDANDQLDGGDDDDTLRGGPGNDRLLGGPGDDKLDGGTGQDSCDGGDGNDDRNNCE
jgi:hypothetical protein